MPESETSHVNFQTLSYLIGIELQYQQLKWGHEVDRRHLAEWFTVLTAGIGEAASWAKDIIFDDQETRGYENAKINLAADLIKSIAVLCGMLEGLIDSEPMFSKLRTRLIQRLERLQREAWDAQNDG